MLSKLLEHVLVLTSISPVFLAMAFIEVVSLQNKLCGIPWFFLWLLLLIMSFLISRIVVRFSERNLESMPITVRSVAPADKEVAAFLIAYLLPLSNIITVNVWTEIFIVMLLYVAILTTSNYHFNPLLSIWGYHYYEITIESKDEDHSQSYTYILMTKKTVRNCKDIKRVVQISDYMLMEVL